MNLTPVIFHKVNKRRIRKLAFAFYLLRKLLWMFWNFLAEGLFDGVECSFSDLSAYRMGDMV